MGKKWQAWFFTFGYLSYIRSAIRFCILDGKLDCMEIVQKINRVICKDDHLRDILSSLSLLKLNHYTGELTYCGAGDLPLVYYSSRSRSLQTLRASGLLLGLLEEGDFDEQKLLLEKGDKVLLVTDGVTDMNIEGMKKNDFSSWVERLAPMLKGSSGFQSIKKYLATALTDDSQTDDASLIFIERTNLK